MAATEVRKTAPRRQTKQSGKTIGSSPKPKEARERVTEKPVVQLRLRGEESIDLEYSMRVLALGSTSEALREGLRLLHREASEVEAAANIRAFYQGEPAPLPEGVVPADEADLIAADESEW